MCEEKKAAPEKDAKKAESKVTAKGGKKRRSLRKVSYAIYIYKVMKKVHPPDTGISTEAVSIMNSFVNDIFECMAGEASRLAPLQQAPRPSAPGEVCTAVPTAAAPGDLAQTRPREKGTK
ncbi:histone H2B 1/2-like [Heptranchias perlo]|uniref:histone H2B 1/2-like n=1 Tax=Heptranchias perlo TaxID=212740 RepID=UPI003559F617